jgi:hypothetical protein
MSRAGVLYSEVAQIAEKLRISGQEPTIERIRAELGTGSNSTIGGHLRAWRAKQDPLQQTATREKIPEELITLLRGLWERVIGQAETQMEVIKAEAEQKATQQKEVLQKLQQENARLQQSEGQWKRAHEGLVQEKVALEQMLNTEKIASGALEAKYAGALQQLETSQAHAAELKKQNQQTQANLEHYRAAALEQRQADQQRAEQQQRELQHALQQLKLENEAIKQQRTAIQKSYDELEILQGGTQAELSNMATHHEKMSIEIIEIRRQFAEKSESQRHWQAQYDTLYGKWEAQLEMMTDMQSKNSVLAQQITAAKQRASEVTDQNKMLAHDKWLLGQEKAQLQGQLTQLNAAKFHANIRTV